MKTRIMFKIILCKIKKHQLINVGFSQSDLRKNFEKSLNRSNTEVPQNSGGGY